MNTRAVEQRSRAERNERVETMVMVMMVMMTCTRSVQINID